jgi:CelD/BcsL family acetyltransferase involved in cellulose biosynthesis
VEHDDPSATPLQPNTPVTSVQRADPRTDPLWAELAMMPGASLFTSPPWISAVTATYELEPTARVCVDSSRRPCGGLAWVDVRDLRGQRRLALPFCDRADPIVSSATGAMDAASWAELTADAFSGDLPFTLRCLDTAPGADDPRFTAVTEAAWHRTPLDRPLDELFAAFKPTTRRNIARAERAGVQVVLSPEAGALEEYHHLHVQLRKRKYRLLAQPLSFFQAAWKSFTPVDGVHTALAQVEGRPVAGAVYFVWQDTVYYKFGASQPAFLRSRPNDAIQWAVINWAHDRGLKALDWGLSGLDQPGLCAFKGRWASTEGRIRILNTGGPPKGQRADVEQMLSQVTELLTEPSVPDDVTARAGAALYRFFC